MADQTPATYDWGTVVSGDTVLARPFTFNFDLTGYTARVQFRESAVGGPDIALTNGDGLTVAGSVVTVDAFTAPPGATAEKTLFYDFELTAPDGTVRTYLRGTLTVLPEFAKATQ